MISHPLFLSVFVLDLIGLLFLLLAVVPALRMLTVSGPRADTSSETETPNQGTITFTWPRYCLWLLVLSTLLLIVGITIVLPRSLPGAMCGAGLMQAMGGPGDRALALRAIAIALLGAWHLLDRLNRQGPPPLLNLATARSLLLALPAVFLSLVSTVRAALRLDPNRPVSCCAAVYDQLRFPAATEGFAVVPDPCLAGAFLSGAVVLGLLGLACWLFPSRIKGSLSVALASITSLWVPVASTALDRLPLSHLSGSPRDLCRWCLFLPENGLLGFVFLATLVVVALEGPSVLICSLAVTRHPVLASKAQKRVQMAGLRIILATVMFSAIAGLPLDSWRRFTGILISL